jgi:purine-binding chemotaxis protein CheW
MEDNLAPVLTAPKHALSLYLEALLRDAPVTAPEDKLVPGAPDVIARQPCAADGPRRTAPFSCLLFKAGGFDLAAPLDGLGGVVPWAPLASLPARAGHILGLLPHLGKQVKVLDPLPLLRPRAPLRVRGRAAHSIVLSASREWGLACEAVSGIVTVHPERVRWRPPVRRTCLRPARKQAQTGGGAEAQPWFSGVVSDRMCALLDMDLLVCWLASKPAGSNGQ